MSAEATAWIILDVDGTCISQQAAILFFQQLAKREPKIRAVFDSAMPLYERYKQRKGSYQDYIDAIKCIWEERLFAGIDRATAQWAAQRAAERCRKRMYVFTRELLLVAKQCGYKIALVSGSPLDVIVEFAKDFQPDQIFATVFPIENDGKFADAPYTSYVHDKRLAINEINASLHPIDRTESVAVGDTRDDAPLFQAVGYPVCFQPKRSLMPVIMEEGLSYLFEMGDVHCILKASPGTDERLHKTSRLVDILPARLGGPLTKRLGEAGWALTHQ